MLSDIMPEITGFEWDQGNLLKNREKHGVECFEAEEIFFNEGLVLLPDEAHSVSEKRMVAFGVTNNRRFLIIVFTVRKNTQIRVISARDMSKRERKFHHEYEA
jgi:uncharacterized DUF497 family protein